MKGVIFLLAILSLSIQATDVVGDRVLHSIFSNNEHIGFIQREYKSGRSLNTLNLETLTADVSGNIVDSKEEEVSRESAFTKEMAQSILDNCSTYGGVNENLSLGDKNFETCKLPIGSDVINGFIPKHFQKSTGIAWFGKVPVNGIVALSMGDLTLIYNSSTW